MCNNFKLVFSDVKTECDINLISCYERNQVLPLAHFMLLVAGVHARTLTEETYHECIELYRLVLIMAYMYIVLHFEPSKCTFIVLQCLLSTCYYINFFNIW